MNIEQEAAVVDALKLNDLRFSGEKATIKDARVALWGQLGFVPRHIGRLATHCCKFWRNPEFDGIGRPKTKRKAYKADEWSAIREWLARSIREGKIDLLRDTYASVCRKARIAGVSCSEYAIREVCQLRKIDLASNPRAA